MKGNIKWSFLKVSIPYMVGQLSGKMLEHVINRLTENGFVARVVTANPSTAVIVLEEDKKSLVIEPQQITYSMRLDGVFEHSAIQNDLEVLLNVLLIDDKNQYLFNIEGISETTNSHTESRVMFEEKYMPLDEDIYGVGYRFLIKSEKLFGEFKIEPLVSDVKGYYYQWLLNKSESVSVAEVLNDVMNEIEKDRDCCYSVLRR